MPDDKPEVLSIGAIDGGSTDGGVCKKAVQEVGRAVRLQREGVVSPLNVNVVFHIGGRFQMPEFEGVRTGTYSKRDRHLMVQAALVPDQTPHARGEVLRLLASGGGG